MNARAETKGDVRDEWVRPESRGFMSANLCRCAAYPNIVDAITDMALNRIAITSPIGPHLKGERTVGGSE
jgi:xanthine dehydrogenase iron-sulfur cluster and FAD-binding subunit A